MAQDQAQDQASAPVDAPAPFVLRIAPDGATVGTTVRGFIDGASLGMTDGAWRVTLRSPKGASTVATSASIARARARLGAERSADPAALAAEAFQGSVTLSGDEAQDILTHYGIALDALPTTAAASAGWKRFVSEVTQGTARSYGVRIILPEHAEGFVATDATYTARLEAMLAD